MHPAEMPILPITQTDLTEMNARLVSGPGADDDEDALSIMRLRRRPTSPLDLAVESLEMEGGEAGCVIAPAPGEGGRAPASLPAPAPAAPATATPAPMAVQVQQDPQPSQGVQPAEMDTAPARRSPLLGGVVPGDPEAPSLAESTVKLSAEQIERALVAAEVANQTLGEPPARAPSPPVMPPLDGDTPPAGLAAVRLGPPPTPPPSATDFGQLDIPERSEDSLDDIVSELVKDDRKDSARRRAQQRKTRLPWWQEIFDAAFLDLTPPRSTRAIEAESALFARALQLKAGARVLDVACGEGHHSIELAKLGCEVVGYDLSPDMVAAAERNAQKAGVEITYVVDDMRAPEKVGGDFDAVMCVGTSFGYFDDGTNVEVLAKMRGALRDKKGPLLIHGFNRDHAAANLPQRSLWRIGEHIISEEADFDALTSRLKVHKQVVYADGEVRDWPISIRLYAAHELRNLMRALEATATRVAGPPRYSGCYLGAMCRELLVLGLWG